MKKVVFLIAMPLLLLIGCTDENREYEQFLSSEEGTYTLFYVEYFEENEEKLDYDYLREHDIRNTVGPITFADTTEVTESMPDMDEIPTYVLFDTEDKVYETHSREDLIEFLQEN
ncbi:hypothetical protein SAMN05421734_101150 [Pelagirhabdus alkalitolerans]|uniref:Uncharacterized protein n=1 Tax=Pelagirhabdus alkalitolerans TaxID=1612202 RepID=A0A1G6GIR8_9BACI|nr:hypothetical protein [Pelagirhabdus alkalitolerans]SDB81911.1 hypothetical protein SAMN05421734_101150 [Pelagirhabdus alkalitolerans]